MSNTMGNPQRFHSADKATRVQPLNSLKIRRTLRD